MGSYAERAIGAWCASMCPQRESAVPVRRSADVECGPVNEYGIQNANRTAMLGIFTSEEYVEVRKPGKREKFTEMGKSSHGTPRPFNSMASDGGDERELH